MEGEPTYTVFVRLPFPRGDFVDPPPVNWDASKDEALWKILSGVAKTEIDWDELALRFDVTVDFLSQQVTYLTDRHTSQVRAQLRRVTAAARSSAAPSPVPPGSELAAGMSRTGSAQGLPGHARAPSALSIRKDSPMPRNDASVPGTPQVSTPTTNTGPGISRPVPARTSSGGQTAQSGGAGSASGSLRLKTATKPPSPRTGGRHRLSSLPVVSPSTPLAEAPGTMLHAQDPPSPGPGDSPSEQSSDASSSPAQSRIIRRPRFQQPQQLQPGARSFLDEEEEDEAEPAFLPFRDKASGEIGESGGSGGGSGGGNSGSAQYTDPGATLRGDPRDFAANAARRLQNVTNKDPPAVQGRGKGKEKERILQHSQTSDSSASSAVFASKPSIGDRRHPSNPLSPRRTSELKSKQTSREGSDGTPSMGSSFSDLDDASVTKSALEEALASQMQGGTIGSTISNVFRSRYMPK